MFLYCFCFSLPCSNYLTLVSINQDITLKRFSVLSFVFILRFWIKDSSLPVSFLKVLHPKAWGHCSSNSKGKHFWASGRRQNDWWVLVTRVTAFCNVSLSSLSYMCQHVLSKVDYCAMWIFPTFAQWFILLRLLCGCEFLQFSPCASIHKQKCVCVCVFCGFRVNKITHQFV